jgi:carbonic anhydrase
MTSAPNPALSALIERNRAYAKAHTPIVTNTELKASGIPAYKTLIITCTDGRIRPEKFLDIENHHGTSLTLEKKNTEGPARGTITLSNRGIEFLISRNSGARARPALANLLALDELVGLDTVLVIGHTDCGAHNFDEDAIREKLRERVLKEEGAPRVYEGVVEGLEFGKIEGR